MEKENKNGDQEIKYFFLAIKDKKGEYYVYMSERFRIPEYELLSLLKILLTDRRMVSVGRKLLWAYQDSQNYSNDAYQKLKEKGIEVERNEIEKVKEGKTI